MSKYLDIYENKILKVLIYNILSKFRPVKILNIDFYFLN